MNKANILQEYVADSSRYVVLPANGAPLGN